ncbi:MAG: protein translocase SEC61 complex subunit gamma [Nanobdellota archaeon]
MINIKNFIKECIRVFKVTKKPTKKEFTRVFQITGLGVLLIGLIGFTVMILYGFLLKGII